MLAGTHGVLQLPLLALAHEHADDHDAQKGQQRECQRQADSQAPPQEAPTAQTTPRLIASGGGGIRRLRPMARSTDQAPPRVSRKSRIGPRQVLRIGARIDEGG